MKEELKVFFKKRVFKLLLSILLLIAMINGMTIHNGANSGNGNPALLFIYPLYLLLIWFGIEWIVHLNKIKLGYWTQIIVVIISLIFIVYGIFTTMDSIRNFKVDLWEKANVNGGVNISWYQVFADPYQLTVYTNTLYFNYVNFALYISCLHLVAIVIRLIRNVFNRVFFR